MVVTTLFNRVETETRGRFTSIDFHIYHEHEGVPGEHNIEEKIKNVAFVQNITCKLNYRLTFFYVKLSFRPGNDTIERIPLTDV